jgi:hypothetical protein
MSNYGSLQGDFSSFSGDEKLNYSLKIALSRLQTDLVLPWFEEPTDFIPKQPLELYKNVIPTYASIKNFLLIDPDVDGSGTEMVTDKTVGDILSVSGNGSQFTLNDILNTSKVRDPSNAVYSKLSDSDFVDGASRTQIKLLGRNMFTRYKYWTSGLTGKSSLLKGIAKNVVDISSGTTPDPTEPFNAYITYTDTGELSPERRWSVINGEKEKEGGHKEFYNKLISEGVELNIIDPTLKSNLTKKHPFLKLCLQVLTYTTRGGALISPSDNNSSSGSVDKTDNIGFHNPLMEKALGDTNGFLSGAGYQMTGWNGKSWKSVTTSYGTAGHQNILYFVSNPGFILVYGQKNIDFGYLTSRSHPPMITFLKYTGETFANGIISQGENRPVVAADKDLFIDTSENTMYRFDGGWEPVGGGGSSVEVGSGTASGGATGDLFYNPISKELQINKDGSASGWETVGGGGSSVTVGSGTASGGTTGDLFYNTSSSELQIKKDDTNWSNVSKWGPPLRWAIAEPWLGLETVQSITVDSEQNNSFGCSVALTKNWALVGDHRRNCANIYKNNNNIWTYHTKVEYNDGGFGWRVALTDNWALVATKSLAKMFVYKRVNDTWSPLYQEIDTTGLVPTHGKRIAMTDTWIVVVSKTTVMFYTNDGNTWSVSQTEYPWTTIQKYSNVAITDNWCIVSGGGNIAKLYKLVDGHWNMHTSYNDVDSVALTDSWLVTCSVTNKKATIRKFVGGTVWQELSSKNLDDVLSDDLWQTQEYLRGKQGASVAMTDNNIIIGIDHNNEDGDGGRKTGAVVMFTRDGDSWGEKITHTKNIPGFGRSVALTTDFVLIGAAKIEDVIFDLYSTGGREGTALFYPRNLLVGYGDGAILKDTGNVGIGTDTPEYKLDVSGIVNAITFNGDLTGNANTATEVVVSPLPNEWHHYLTMALANNNIQSIRRTPSLHYKPDTKTLTVGNGCLFSNGSNDAYFSNSLSNTMSNYALRQSGTSLTYLNVGIGGQVNLSIGGATKAALKSNGDFYFHNNVGIGTDSPHKNLVIFGDNATLRIDSIYNGTTKFQMVHSGDQYQSDVDSITGFEIQHAMHTGHTTARTYFGHYGGNPTFNKHMTIYRTSGYVGIGTDTPGYKLDVAGTIKATNLKIADDGIFLNHNQLYALNNKTLYLNWHGGGDIHMVGQTGSVGIGTAPSSSYKLDVGGTIKADSLRIGIDGTPGDIFIQPQNGNDSITNNNTIRNGLIWKTTHSSYSVNSAAIYFQPEGNGFSGGLTFYTKNTNSYVGSTATQLWNEGFGERMRIDMNGNVGIGTDSPKCPLNITSTIARGNATIPNLTTNINGNGTCSLFLGKSYGSEKNYWGMWMGTIYDVAGGDNYGSYIQSGNDSNHYPILLNPMGGNVGIGTKNPIGSLTIGEGYAGAPKNEDNMLIIGRSDGGMSKRWVGMTLDSNFCLSFGDCGYGTSSKTTLDKKAFRISYAAPTNTLVLSGAGNVGIGTDTPLAKLDVVGHMRIGAGQPGEACPWRLRIQGNAGASAQIYATGGYYGINVTTAHSSGGYYSAKFVGSGGKGLTVWDGGNCVAGGSVTANGYLQTTGGTGWVNTTHSGGWTMYDAKWVRSYGSSHGVMISGSARYAWTGYYFQDLPTFIPWGSALVPAGSNVGLLVNGAGAGIVANWIGFKSDRRIKKNIEDIDDGDALKILRKIPVRYYNYIDEVSKGNQKVAGFIAQEVKEHFPCAISFSPYNTAIPNIFKRITNELWEEKINDLSKNDLSKNDLSKNDLSKNEFILTNFDVVDSSGVISSIDISGGSTYKFFISDTDSEEEEKEVLADASGNFVFDKKWENLYLYGICVKDFHIVDKAKIFAIGFSATQEIDRIQQSEKAKLEEQTSKLEEQTSKFEEQTSKLAAAEAKITELEAENTSLKSRLDTFEARLTAAGI